ncbi:UBA/THIF-type NAD/FAD binding protein, partial [mine drainage metagenome]
MPGVLGALQASEAVKLATGVGTPLSGRLLTYDALDLRFTELPVSRRVDCPVCGEHPRITAPQEMPGILEAAATRTAQRLSPRDLRDLMNTSRTDAPAFVLIDVREPWEFHARHLEQARNIPLGELEGRLAEWAGRAIQYSFAAPVNGASSPARWRFGPGSAHRDIWKAVCLPGATRSIRTSRCRAPGDPAPGRACRLGLR